MRTSRVLPVAEWPRLAGTLLERAWPLLAPDATAIVVVEQDGQIIGCAAVIRCTHLEGVWVHPAYRKHAAVVRRGIDLVLDVVERQAGERRGLFLTTDDPDVAAALIRLGGAPLPGVPFVVPVPCRSRVEDKAHG